jgi:adhesin transport system outer membrane protein
VIWIPVARHGLLAFTAACGCLCLSQAVAQEPVVSLSQVLEAVAANYPVLIAARTEARAAAQDVQAAERLRWPSVSATVESETGNLRSYPNRALQVDQTVWDAGRNTARIDEAKTLAQISLLKVHAQQQDVFLQVASAWQNMVSARSRLTVADLTLERLKTYRAQMLRRVQAEVSPAIDLELVDSRLLQTEVVRNAAFTALQMAYTRLSQFSGLASWTVTTSSRVESVSLDDTQSFANMWREVDLESLSASHPQVARARLEVQQTKQRLTGKQAEAFPQVFLRVYKPLNALPNNPDTSMTAFVGLRYTPGAGWANLVESQAIQTRVITAEQSVEAVFRDTLQTMQNDRDDFVNTRSRVMALEKSIHGAEKVLDSYQRQFQAGRKSWLDLLNAVREWAQNQYALADARAAMLAAMHRLQIRSGRDVQTPSTSNP